jgi:hypothetical protein
VFRGHFHIEAKRRDLKTAPRLEKLQRSPPDARHPRFGAGAAPPGLSCKFIQVAEEVMPPIADKL